MPLVKQEARTCEICGKSVKYYGAHVRKAHPSGELLSSAPSAPEGGVPLSVRFLSTRAPSLFLVIKPTQYRVISTPAGEQPILVEGKSVQFQNGEFETDDPEIIRYLEEKYTDQRFPIISMRKAHESLSASTRSTPAFKR